MYEASVSVLMKWSRFKWPWPSFYRCSPRRASQSRMCVNQKSPPFEFARPERAAYGCFISAVTHTAMKRPAGILTAFVCVSHGGSNISLRPEGSTGTLFFMKTTRTGRMLRSSIRLILKNVCVQPRSLDLKAVTFTLNAFGTFYTSILERALLIFLENGATVASRLITLASSSSSSLSLSFSSLSSSSSSSSSTSSSSSSLSSSTSSS